MKLIFASRNKNKFLEIEKIIPKNIQLGNLNELNFYDEIPENEETIEGNATFKAEFIHSKFGVNVFADDTGLEVEVLNGKPGVHSARFAGIECNSNKNINKLLELLKNKKNRKARFKTIIVLIFKQQIYQFEGIVNGEILYKRKGKNGFGYDSIFKPMGLNKSFAELSIEIKNKISHRAIAMSKLIDFIKEIKS
ncbi:MAG: RdgB/HAM1 family non-canonical purine NTP pyrophosphatase [Flavobacteriaceae bacterium]|nr:RdgB/HAM1 family non-canonical purine NTP pyrophosphatase [Flavobacteriaceae bacterium]MDG2368415.1 RdgB/HAM1 family non-canonical purine NTP pyrophosphatase [Flavobacteriaceae bacterium]